MQLRLTLGLKKGSATATASPGGAVALEAAPVPEETRLTQTRGESRTTNSPAKSAVHEYYEEPGSTSNVSPMIKTYTASSIAQAMLMARTDLGDDAILIQSKTMDAAPGSILQYQVTFGVVHGATPREAINELRARTSSPRPAVSSSVSIAPPVPPPALLPAAVPPPLPPAPADHESAAVTSELAALRRELIALQTMFLDTPRESCPPSLKKARNVYSTLLKQDVDHELALEIATAVEHRLVNATNVSENLERATLSQELASRVKAGHSTASAHKPILLIGPPASGKTTMLLKLALERGIRKGRPVEVLSLDCGKGSPNRGLEMTAGILGADFRAVNSPEALRLVLERSRPAETLVLIEVTGLSASPLDAEMDLAPMFQSGLEVEMHLVLSAAWHPASTRKAVDRYEVFQPSHLLFTMTDQAATFGTILKEAVRTSKTLSYFGANGLGAGTLEVASTSALLNRIWNASAGS